MFRAGEKVVVAVSGGVDSVALLDILAGLESLGLELVVAHLNHNLRGDESDADAAFVADLAFRYGLPFESGSADVLALSREWGMSLEESGRAARYRWLDSVAQKHGAEKIALGHHADDQAETVLLRLLRGAGTTGLAGMRPLSSGRYARPLLYATRAEIIGYAEKKGISFRYDSSNDDTLFLRNRIRHELLPELRTYNPAISERLSVAAEILAADEEVLESLVAGVFNGAANPGGDGVTLALGKVCAQPAGIRFRLYRRALLEANGTLARISLVHLRQIEDLARSGRVNGQLHLPGGVRVRRRYDELVFPCLREIPDPGTWEMLLKEPGCYLLPDGSTLSLAMVPPPENWRAVPSLTAYLDPVAASFPLLARTFRAGDRLRPLGMTGSKKVKDLFIDEKVPADLRRRLPLLFARGTLLWVGGVRVAEDARVRPGSGNVLEVEIRRQET
ncbi:MAG: tRNA lysidine(34) synthetase TilS [Geobacteraceae bacterium]|nr:tRNA lysidine(34) synthetase TilS [Geobacteraceae bacterium]